MCAWACISVAQAHPHGDSAASRSRYTDALKQPYASISMSRVTLYHNPNCSKSRAALALLTASSTPFNVVEYLQTPLDATQLKALLSALATDAAQLVRKDSHFRDLGLVAADYTTPEQVIELLVAQPNLMQRPIAVRDGHAVIGRPPEDINSLLD